MSSKARILARLRAARTPFTDVPPVAGRLRMTPLADHSPAALRERFIAESERVSARVYPCADDAAAIRQVLALTAGQPRVMAWDASFLPHGLADALSAHGTHIGGDLRDTDIRTGITGVDAALAATGSLIVSSGAGKPRAASLLPPVHIAIVRATQILPDLEAYFEQARADGLASFRASANTVVITGGSRTADIAQELIQGAHGPVEVHVILIG